MPLLMRGVGAQKLWKRDDGCAQRQNRSHHVRPEVVQDHTEPDNAAYEQANEKPVMFMLGVIADFLNLFFDYLLLLHNQLNSLLSTLLILLNNLFSHFLL